MYGFWKGKLSSNDPSIIAQVIKFFERVQSTPATRLFSTLHNFENCINYSNKTNGGKRTSRRKISVRCEAVKRRNFE